jgi:quercetin dioxygenase-like cupin family protein
VVFIYKEKNMSTAETKNKGAVKGGNGTYIFDLAGLQRMDAGVGYSSAEGPVVEGERIQVGLISMKRGTGARAHSHPNEQWIYLIQGKARASVDGQTERIVGPGTLIYLPANIVHYVQALPDEEVVFFTCKDMSHGIMGMAADGTMAGPHVDPGIDTSKK